MKKVYLKNQLKGYPIEVISNVLDVINVLGENYGANRDIEKDLGGYIVIAENIVVIEMLKKDKLQGGLMSISWTQKVKLFYAVLLANNSHCSGVM